LVQVDIFIDWIYVIQIDFSGYCGIVRMHSTALRYCMVMDGVMHEMF